MNGYFKINNNTGGHKSRSIDFSDFFSSFPQTPKSITRRNSATAGGPDTPNINQAAAKLEEEHDDEKGVRFGVILGRSSSVSSSSGIHATMKRAFSISNSSMRRRSSSVSERYCRIHDQSMAIASSPPPSIDHVENKKQRGGKILKACKRLLGF